MLHKIDLGKDKAVGFSWEGKYDEKAFKQSVLQFLPELQSKSEMNVYLEVHDITDVQAKALWDEIKFDVKNFKELTEKIDRIALVTDLEWLKGLSKASFSLMPSLSIKTFDLKDKGAARVWVVE